MSQRSVVADTRCVGLNCSMHLCIYLYLNRYKHTHTTYMRIFTIFQQQPYSLISNSAYQPSQAPILPELLRSYILGCCCWIGIATPTRIGIAHSTRFTFSEYNLWAPLQNQYAPWCTLKKTSYICVLLIQPYGSSVLCMFGLTGISAANDFQFIIAVSYTYIHLSSTLRCDNIKK